MERAHLPEDVVEKLDGGDLEDVGRDGDCEYSILSFLCFIQIYFLT